MRIIKKIIKTIYRFVELKLPFMRNFLRTTRYNHDKKAYDTRYSHKTNDKKVVFMVFAGRNYACSPKAVYKYMIEDEKYNDWEFIWVFKQPELFEPLAANNKNTKVIKWLSPEHYEAMSTAKYWLSNNRIPVHVWPREDQVYVQCWHGTPLKRLGYDLDNTVDARNTLDELLEKYDDDVKKIRWFLSPSRYASECFTSAFNLKGNGKEDALLEIGYPRNDAICTYTPEDKRVIKSNLGIPENSEKKIILYAPTYRENQYSAKDGYVYDTHLDFHKLRARLGEEYIILFRTHYYVSSGFDFDGFDGYIMDFSDYHDINHLYIAADLLITDYSSVFFDFANTRKPMLYYMYDLEEYRDEARGFYLDYEELPGDIILEEKDLADAIEFALDSEKYKEKYGEKYEQFHAKYDYLDDGNASRRFVESVFEDYT